MTPDDLDPLDVTPGPLGPVRLTFEPMPDWMLDEMRERDAQTEPTPDRALPLGQAGTKYDHARRATSTYHLDSSDLAMGDRHLLIEEVRRSRRTDPLNPSPLPRFREQRRRSRWNCSVIALVAALIVFWGTVGVILWKVVAG